MKPLPKIWGYVGTAGTAVLMYLMSHHIVPEGAGWTAIALNLLNQLSHSSTGDGGMFTTKPKP